MPAGAAVLVRRRRFAVEDRVVQTATSYIPLDVVAAAPAVAYTGSGPGGIYARMAEAGIEPEMLPERLICRPPTAAEVTALSLSRGAWIIAITRRAYTAGRRCVEVNEMVLDASAYELENVFGV